MKEMRVNRVAMWCKCTQDTLVHYVIVYNLLCAISCYSFSVTKIIKPIFFSLNDSNMLPTNSLLPLLSPAIPAAYHHGVAGLSLAGLLFCTTEKLDGLQGPDKRTGAKDVPFPAAHSKWAPAKERWGQEGGGEEPCCGSGKITGSLAP